VLDGLEGWDVALLQEAPPRWFRELCQRTRSSGVRVLTSRNWLPPLQRRLADLNPDLLASSDGGSNQILVRHPGRIVDHNRLTLAWKREQRRMHWARVVLPGSGGTVCVANLHASACLPELAGAEVVRAAKCALEWSAGDPLVFGGDLNLCPARTPQPFAALRDLGLAEPTAPDAIDHLLVRGFQVEKPPRRLAAERRELPGPDGRRIRLSDHAPVSADLGTPGGKLR